MRIINKANDKIIKLWDEGKILPTAYRMLTYIITAEVDDGALLHNVITGELLFLDKEEIKNISALPCGYAPWMDELIRKHFLVRAELDDKKTVDSLRFAAKLMYSSKDITDYTILPTTNCNARCFYCYEAGCKHENMSDETADRLVSFMEEHRGGKHIHLNWFGGEPLVGMRQIDRICSALNEKRVPFHSDMISNGYLFDEESVKRAKTEWNLRKIQITLDGKEKTYNETKAYVNPCASPYQRVLNNIELLVGQDIQVEIRFNIGLHNAEELSELADELSYRFEDKSNILVYTRIIQYNCGFSPMSLSSEQAEILFDKFNELNKKIAMLFPNIDEDYLPELKHNCCKADSDSAVVVLPSGRIIKCEETLDKHSIGSIYEGITDTDECKAMKERVSLPACEHCILYPSCIRLKQCEKGSTCSDEVVSLRIAYAKRIMQFLYGKYQSEKESSDESARVPNC